MNQIIFCGTYVMREIIPAMVNIPKPWLIPHNVQPNSEGKCVTYPSPPEENQNFIKLMLTLII